MKRIVIWIAAFAIAMAFVEAAVVVYLRALGPAGPWIGATLPVLPSRILAIETAREAATIAMLAAVAALAGRDRWERFLSFWLAFAVWDLGYYAWLRVLTGWPPSLLAWDVLFLIPVPWTAPVLAPVLVSIGMIAAAYGLLHLHILGMRLGSRGVVAGALCAGGALMFASFVVDYRGTTNGHVPERFRWGLFLCGLGFSAAGLGLGWRRAETRTKQAAAQVMRSD